jgi:lipopolysaccharide transport system ATP-binding protein
MSRVEIVRKLEEIVGFAEVEKFIDTPVKRYSSGMHVRLAFAVAAHLDPEILIVDEVLAVGDAQFQNKCLGKMRDVARGGRTILFVSHNMAAVETLCSKAIELHSGSIVSHGAVDNVLAHYRRQIVGSMAQDEPCPFDNAQFFSGASLIDQHGSARTFIELGREFHLRVNLACVHAIRHPQIGIGIDNLTGQRMLTIHTPKSRRCIGPIIEKSVIHCRIAQFPLAPGEYTIKLSVTENCQEIESIDPALRFVVTDAEQFDEGRGHHRGVCIAPSEWWQEIPKVAMSKQ